MNKIIIAILVAVLVVLGGIFLLNRDTERAKPPAERPQGETQETIVIYSDNGYSPETLTLKQGQTLTFRNESSRLMWTASAVHPTHTILPEFDPRAGVSRGEEYSFTFTKKGSFKYHNHLAPGHTGTVIVE